MLFSMLKIHSQDNLRIYHESYFHAVKLCYCMPSGPKALEAGDWGM